MAALFKCLLSMPGQRAHRDYIQELLWPEAEPHLGARNLRVTLHRLRRLLGQSHPEEGYLRLEGPMLALHPAATAVAADWLDASAFERAATAALASQVPALCRSAIELYGGVYLPEDLYAEWAAARREALRQQYLAVLLHLAALRERQGNDASSVAMGAKGDASGAAHMALA